MARTPTTRRLARWCYQVAIVMASLAVTASLVAAAGPAQAASAASLTTGRDHGQVVHALGTPAITASGSDYTITFDPGSSLGSTDPTLVQHWITQLNGENPHLSDTIERLLGQYSLPGLTSAPTGWPEFDGTLSLTPDNEGVSLTIPAAEVQPMGTGSPFWDAVIAGVAGVFAYALVLAGCGAIVGVTAGPLAVACAAFAGAVGGFIGGVVTQALGHTLTQGQQWGITLVGALLGAIANGTQEKILEFGVNILPGILTAIGSWLTAQAQGAWATLGLAGVISAAVVVIGGVAAVLAGLLNGGSSGLPAGSLPCDIYAFYGTSCVAAYSTVRALYQDYDGPLYQVQRASDRMTANIGLLGVGGYVDASQQDSFCADTTCTITKLYDQSSVHNDLTIAPGGGAAPGADNGANASALQVKVDGNDEAYGIDVTEGVGYRNNAAYETATGDTPEGMYMVTSGIHANSQCCFDFGNAETTSTDNHAGHMDAVNFSTTCTAPCTGTGPWVEADLEDGLYMGGNGSNTANAGNNTDFVTAMLKNDGQSTYELQGGDAQSGDLSTWWNGSLPTVRPGGYGYIPMSKEGAIILGIGGDNSNRGTGSFFEGAMTLGLPSDTADAAVQASIVSASYSGNSDGISAVADTVTNASGKCLDVLGDDVGTNLTQVDIWDCQGSAQDQHWTHNADGSLETLGRCLDIDGDSTVQGALVELWDCNGAGGQVWNQQQDGEFYNPQSGLCLDDPNGNQANGTQLRIWPCNSSTSAGGTVTTAQEFNLTDGNMVTNIPSGQCMDVIGDDIGGNGSPVDLWGCQSYAIDQHWTLNSNGTVSTLGFCLDTAGGGTSAGTPVVIANCDGSATQEWTWQTVPEGSQSDTVLMNIGAGLQCLTAPNDNTANGTRLQISACSTSPSQEFSLG